MYIRRKVFSLIQDEYGEERYFSTTDFELENRYFSKNKSKNYETKAQKRAREKAEAAARQAEINRKIEEELENRNKPIHLLGQNKYPGSESINSGSSTAEIKKQLEQEAKKKAEEEAKKTEEAAAKAAEQPGFWSKTGTNLKNLYTGKTLGGGWKGRAAQVGAIAVPVAATALGGKYLYDRNKSKD